MGLEERRKGEEIGEKGGGRREKRQMETGDKRGGKEGERKRG